MGLTHIQDIDVQQQQQSQVQVTRMLKVKAYSQREKGSVLRCFYFASSRFCLISSFFSILSGPVTALGEVDNKIITGLGSKIILYEFLPYERRFVGRAIIDSQFYVTDVTVCFLLLCLCFLLVSSELSSFFFSVFSVCEELRSVWRCSEEHSSLSLGCKFPLVRCSP
jgi:hypothetical protein